MCQLPRMLLGIIVVGTAALTACGPDGPDSPIAATDSIFLAPDASADAQTLGASPDAGSDTAATVSGVGVRADGCSLASTIGSGAIVEQAGRVVTVAHTIAGATTVVVVDAAGRAHEARVIAFDKDRDLAVLRSNTLAGPALPLGVPRTGAASLLTWRPDDGVVRRSAEITRLLAVTIEDIYTEGRAERNGLEVDGAVTLGDSGGPVLDRDGFVVGVVYATSRARPGIAFATDSNEIAAVLATIPPDEPTVSNGRCR